MTRSVKIGKYTAHPENPPIFLAEIGSYYNGDVNLAEKMIGTVIEGLQAVPHQPSILKTEILNNPDICLKTNTIEIYTNKSGHIKQESYRELIERKVMSLKDYRKIFGLIKRANVDFIVSVYDFEAADFAASEGACALKIASSNVVHIPLIRYVAKFGLPIIVDTGRTNIAEVHHAISALRNEGCQDIIIQHSPDGHPALPQAHNLRIMQTYQQCFNLPVGLSDHYVGSEMLYVATALGATVLEKGLSFDPNELDQDISHSMGMHELVKVLRTVYDCWQALGAHARPFNQVIEGVIGTSQRQCLVAKKDLKIGDRISLDTVRFAFPCLGIPVENWDKVIGSSLRSSVKQDMPIEWLHVE